MDSVSIRLQGGLGNYLFQIACSHSYALKHNKEFFLTESDAIICHNSLNCYKPNILNKVNLLQSKSHNGFEQYVEPAFSYNKIPFIQGNVYLSNYFQSEKYFKEHTKEIRELFSFPEKFVKNIKEKYENYLNEDVCFIHVRRGNYLQTQDFHLVLDLNYYMRAIKEIGKKSTFLVFSDDLEWCKENFPNSDNFVFVEGLKDYEDLLLMSMCKNGIIANSSFSWWGAWLNKNENKKIIAPKTWFGPSFSNFDTKDLYCEDWMKI